MAANVVRVEAATPDEDIIGRAAALLREGGLVAFPTETVYGLGANALDPAAVRRIFAAKGRPARNPLIVHVPDVAKARQIVTAWPAAAARAAEAFWPGPLTLVLPKSSQVPDEVTAGLGSVAVRVPAHPVALALLRRAGVPVAAPSANRFTHVSPTSAAHVARGLGDRVDLILDGGVTPYGIESAVLDLAGARPRLLRHGAIGIVELEEVLGPIDVAVAQPSASRPGEPGAGDRDDDADAAGLPSPGMLHRHYSPSGTVVVFADAVRAASLAAEAHAAGRRVGALLLSLSVPGADQVAALPPDARGYARLLYASLHALDDAGCDLILVEQVPDGPEWAAVRDRLGRAAHSG
ncbi:L-threonylcarbamoyladenylate synthase [soil metagenome]